jgi:hypothetical protein
VIGLPLMCMRMVAAVGSFLRSVTYPDLPAASLCPTLHAVVYDKLLQGWNRAASCTACGEGPWLSSRASSIDILDTNTGETADVQSVRGSPEACYIQQGMGVTKLSSSGVLQAVICPVNFFGSSVTRHGLTVVPCAACPRFTVTVGDDGRAMSYNNTAGEAVAIAEGGYYSISACVTQPGYGYYGDGAQECPQGYYNSGKNLLPCTQ